LGERRLYLGRDAGGADHYQPDPWPRWTTRSRLSRQLAGQGRPTADRELRFGTRPLLPRYRPLPERDRGPRCPGRAADRRRPLARSLSEIRPPAPPPLP